MIQKDKSLKYLDYIKALILGRHRDTYALYSVISCSYAKVQLIEEENNHTRKITHELSLTDL